MVDWALLIGNGSLLMNNMALLTSNQAYGSFDG